MTSFTFKIYKRYRNNLIFNIDNKIEHMDINSKLKLCVNCFDDSGKCGNCLGELCRFEKCVSVDVPDTMDDFIPIKSKKKRWWCFKF